METTEQLIPTPASEWAGAAAFAGYDLTLPSGNVARVKRITPAAFLSGGTIPDGLSSIIRRAIHTKQGLNPKDLQEISSDPDQLAGALEMLDRVLCQVMVAPGVRMPPTCDAAVSDGYCGLYSNKDIHNTPTRSGHHDYHEGERDASILYADVVDMNDKIFVFQWAVGGTANLEEFREELQASVGNLQDSEDIQLPA